MALVINTNVASINAQRNLAVNQGNLNKAMQRLSSGLRINSAKDDAAGLAISDRMTSQIRGINQAVRNANDGISLAQTAEGALGESTNILQRMRELAVQSANDTNTTGDRASLNAEIKQLQAELNRIALNTKFNGRVILSGGFSTTGMTFQIGPDSGETISIKIAGATATKLAVSTNNVNVSTRGAASASINRIDTAIRTIDTIRGDLGAIQNRFESTISNLRNVSENLSAARSRILDADIAEETANMTKFNILQQAGTAILSQANQAPNAALSLLQG